MRTRVSLIGFAVLLYMLLALLFVSTLKAQTPDGSPFNSSVYDLNGTENPRDFLQSDLLKIVMAGGISRIDTGILGGRVIDDTTLAYNRNGEDMIVHFNLRYIKDGQITDDWSVRVDSALLSVNARGTIVNQKVRQKIEMSSDAYLITGLRHTSNELLVFPPTSKIKPPSTMRIIGIKLKIWMIIDLFKVNEQLYLGPLRIKKTDQDILEGSGLMTVTKYDNNDNILMEKELAVEFIGNHQMKITEDGETRTVNYTSLGFLFP